MKKTFLLPLAFLLLLLGSCATLQEQYAEAIKKEDYEKALAVAEKAKNPEQANYFTEIAVRSRYFSPEKKADLLVRAGTSEAKEALVKLGEDRIREKKFEEGEKYIQLAGLPQAKADARIGKAAASVAQEELGRLNDRVEDKELLQSKDRIEGYEKVRNSFEATRSYALDRLSKSGDPYSYLNAVAYLLAGDLRVEEAEKAIAESKLEVKQKLELTSLANMQAAWSLKVRADAIAYETKSERKTERIAKGKAGFDARYLAAARFARKPFTIAVSLGVAKDVQFFAETLVSYALDPRLGDKADLEAARLIFDHYKKVKDKEWLKLLPAAVALTGAYGEAEALYKEAGIPASEYGLVLSRVATKRNDPSTTVAKFLILSEDKAEMAKSAAEWISDAKRNYSNLYKLSGDEYQKKKAALLIDVDAAAALSAALKNSDLYGRCIDVAYGDYGRMEAYAKAFGIDEKTMCSNFGALCEKYTTYVKAAEYYERSGDRVSRLRVAEAIYKNAKDSYTKQVSQMDLYLELMKANFQSGLPIQEYKKKFDEARSGFIVSRSYWIKDLKISCSVFWSLSEKQKAFDALEFLAQLGAKDEVKEFQAKWLVDDKILLEKLKRAAEKADAEK